MARKAQHPSVVEAVELGDQRSILEAQRRLLAARLIDCEPGATAALSRELRAVTERLEALTPPVRSVSDELAAARAARRGASGAASAR